MKVKDYLNHTRKSLGITESEERYIKSVWRLLDKYLSLETEERDEILRIANKYSW